MKSTPLYDRVEFYLSCRGLNNEDFITKSDPKMMIYLKNNEDQWSLFEETEVQKNTLNPDFQTTVILDFVFETKQELRFTVIDIDKYKNDDFIGEAYATVGELMGAKYQTSTLDLKSKSGKLAGQLHLKGDKLGTSMKLVNWQWSGVKLMNTDGWFGKSDPFLRFFKIKENGDCLRVHETEYIKNNCDPTWKPFKISEDKLWGKNHAQAIRIECWDDQEDKNFRYIGTVDITYGQLMDGQKDFTLYNEKKKKNSGTLRLLSFSKEDRPYSLVDYLRSGTQLGLIAAVDFTASNGIPTDSKSLHAIKSDGTLNEYQKALSHVGQILLNYDYDKQIPVYGFGGVPNFPGFNHEEVSHCFPCTGNVKSPQVQGLLGVMDIYSRALKNVALSGPTHFVPILNEAMKVAQTNKNSNNGVYNILLILTDGAIQDMDETIDLIVKNAHLPLSIIIVGIGKENFDKMKVLDGDKGLVSNGKPVARDYVQFVEFSQFKDIGELTKSVLAEVPNQVVNYMSMIGKKPK